MRERVYWVGVTMFTVGVVSSLSVHAQTPASTAAGGAVLEEIVITAERRDSSVQKTAISISVVQGEAMEQRGNTEFAQVLQNVPGVLVQQAVGSVSGASANGGGGPPPIVIRGLGTDGPNKNTSVQVYQDGILMFGGGADFFDVNRVEILRGPQGTLYGRGGTGGAINVITNNPTHEWEASGKLQLGTYKLMGSQGIFNAPLSDTLAVRVGFNTQQRDGYYSTGQSGNGETNARIKLLYTPSDNVSLLFGGIIYKADRTNAGRMLLTTAFPDAKPEYFKDPAFSYEPTGGRNQISYQRWYADLEWDLGFAKLTFLPSYQKNWSYNRAYINVNPYPSGRVTTLTPYFHAMTDELRLASTGDSRLSWVVGAFYYQNQYASQFDGAIPVPSPDGILGYNEFIGGLVNGVYTPGANGGGTHRWQDFDQNSKALFGEATFKLTDALRFTAGARETWDSVSHIEHNIVSALPQNNFSLVNGRTPTFENFDYKLRVEADLAPNNMIYAVASSGYRPGGGQTDQVYKQENVRAYEVGSKNRFGGAVTVNAAAFYYDYYNGFQMPQGYGAPPFLQFQILAIPAKLYGAELELTAALSANDKLTLSPTYLHGRFTENYTFVSPANGAVTFAQTKDGVVPHQPKYSVSGSYDHIFRLSNGASITAGADAVYQSEAYTGFDLQLYPNSTNGPNGGPLKPVFLQKAYTMYNASLSFSPESGKYSVTVYGHNLGNEIIKYYTQNPNTYVGEPRTAGVILSAKF